MANATFFSPDGGITRYPLEDTEGRIMYADDIDGINQVKIFHPSQTINGITFTVSNGKIIASGTATDTAVFWCSLIDDHYTIPAGNYHASGCPEQPSGSTQYHIGYLCTRNGSDNVYGNETGNGLDFEVLDGDVNLRVGIAIYSGYAIQGTLVFEPMLTEAKYAGIPYRPYNQQSIQHQINDITGVLGAWNFYKTTLTTQTYNGVVWTANADGSVNANGTTNVDSRIAIGTANLEAGNYYLSGCPTPSNVYDWRLRLSKTVNGVEKVVWHDGGDATPFTVSSDYAGAWLLEVRYGNNKAMSNILFKPQIALQPNTPYVPFAMTNRELTEMVVDHTNAPKLIATAAANQTWAAQMTTLKAVYDTLTTPQKARSILGFYGNYESGIFRNVAPGIGNFVLNDSLGGSGDINTYSVRLGNRTAIKITYNTDGTITRTELTNTTNATALTMYLE